MRVHDSRDGGAALEDLLQAHPHETLFAQNRNREGGHRGIGIGHEVFPITKTNRVSYAVGAMVLIVCRATETDSDIAQIDPTELDGCCRESNARFRHISLTSRFILPL